MSQVTIALAFAIAFGAISASLIAAATSLRRRRTRIMATAAYCAGIVAAGVTVASSGLRVNLTQSMPVGVYRLTPVPTPAIGRGTIVAVCAPVTAARLGRTRGYLVTGPCPGGAEPLLKTVVAIAGDEVHVSSDGVRINGRLLPLSKPLPFDRAGRSLTSWPGISIRLIDSQLWLYAGNDRSWDSRYWGPVSARPTIAEARVIYVLGDATIATRINTSAQRQSKR